MPFMCWMFAGKMYDAVMLGKLTCVQVLIHSVISVNHLNRASWY